MVQFRTQGRQVVDFGPMNTGLLPTFLQYKDLDTLISLTQPVVYEVADGIYYFDINFPLSSSPQTTRVVLKVTAGGVSIPLVVTPQPINTNTGAIREVVDFGDAAIGIAPQFLLYDDLNTLASLTQPGFTEIGSGLYYFPYQFPVPNSPATTSILFDASAPTANPISLSPNNGPIAGGTSTTITGTNFLAGATVTFGGTAATAGTITSTTIAVTSPAHTVGAVDVVVTNPGALPGTLHNGFTYTSAYWADHNMPGTSADTYNAVVWASSLSLFVSIGTDGSGNGLAATSPDGVTWTARTMPAGNWTSLAWSGALLVAGGEVVASSNGLSATSTDGVTWTSHAGPGAGGSGSAAIAWGNSTFVAAGYGNGKTWTSTDGATWTARLTSGSGAFSGAVWASGLSLFVIAPSGVGNIYSSPTGVTWTAHTPPANLDGSSLVTNGSRVIVSDVSGNAILSTDGLTYNTQSAIGVVPDSAVWDSVASLFVMNGTAGTFTNANGVGAWATVSTTTEDFFSIATDGARLVGVGGIVSSNIVSGVHIG